MTDINRYPAELPPALWAPSPSNSTGSIRLQPWSFHTPVKRKHHDQSTDPYCLPSTISPAPKLPAIKKPKLKDTPELELSSESEEPSSEPEVLAQQSKRKPRCRAVPSAIPDASSKRYSRGRPRKNPIDPQSCDFSAHVFIEIANPPKLHRGKTHKTDKYVSQGPTTEGPFTFTHHMSWKSFLSQVAELAELEKDNVALT